MRYHEIIAESRAYEVNAPMHGDITVYRDPSFQQIKTLIGRYEELRGISDTRSIYIWDAAKAIHPNVAQGLLIAGLWQGSVSQHNTAMYTWGQGFVIVRADSTRNPMTMEWRLDDAVHPRIVIPLLGDLVLLTFEKEHDKLLAHPVVARWLARATTEETPQRSDHGPAVSIDEAIDFKNVKKAAAGVALGAMAYMGQPTHEPASKPAEVVQVRPTISDRDAKLLALTIWGEARSHGREGMLAVGHVIKNRVEAAKKRFGGDSIEGVVKKRKQFSCWNASDPNRSKLLNLDAYLAELDPGSPDRVRWEEAKKIAEDILAGRSADPTRGALYYHTDAINPDWSKGIKPVTKFANHVFYRDHAVA